MTISPNQLRSARAHLNLGLKDVSAQTGIGTGTISDLEQDKTANPRSGTIESLKKFYQMRGVEFTEDGGIRPYKVRVQEYEGAEGFRRFMDDVYEVAKTQGGEICLHNAKPENWIKWLGKEWNEFHTNRMLNIKNDMNFKITAGNNDYLMIGKHAEYRWLPEEMWNEQSFYAYGDRIALLNFEENNVHIVVMYNKRFVEGFKSLFNVTWNSVAIIPEKRK